MASPGLGPEASQAGRFITYLSNILHLHVIIPYLLRFRGPTVCYPLKSAERRSSCSLRLLNAHPLVNWAFDFFPDARANDGPETRCILTILINTTLLLPFTPGV
jgi:hypothetical protein